MERIYVFGIVFGAWLIAAPWVLGFSSINLAFWNSIFSGSAIILFVAWRIVYSKNNHV